MRVRVPSDFICRGPHLYSFLRTHRRHIGTPWSAPDQFAARNGERGFSFAVFFFLLSPWKNLYQTRKQRRILARVILATAQNIATPQKSLLPPEVAGLMYFTGPRGVGKSFLAAQADIPDNVLFIDFEEKGTGIDAQLHFGRYISFEALVSEKHGAEAKPLQRYKLLKETFDSIAKDRYSVCVLDNIQPFEEALAAQVRDNPMAYGIKPGHAESGAYGGVWPAVNSLVNGYVNHLYAKGIRLVIAIAHLKPDWAGGAPVPNRFRAKGVDRWQDLSILSLVIVGGDHPPIPSALVMKEQLGRIEFLPEEGEFRVRRRLPLRLPKATFGAIRHYLDNPADLNKPGEGEVPTEEEVSPYQAKFSKEQLAFIRLQMIAKETKENEEENG